MSLTHAILGLLTIQPMTGYDLKHGAFDETIVHFWQADQAQIYRTLDRMAQQGWVTSTLEVQTDRPNRKVYAITEAGRSELSRWLHTQQQLPANREAFLVQFFFAAELPNSVIARHIAEQRAQHEARLEQLEAIAVVPPPDALSARRQTLWQLTLDLGVTLEHTYLDWLDRAAAAVTDLAETDAGHPG